MTSYNSLTQKCLQPFLCWSFWCLPANQIADPKQIQTSALSCLSQAGSSLAWGWPQIPAEPAHFFSFVTETQHPQGPKSQQPEINGFAQITWHTRRETQGFSPLLFIPLPLSSLCLFSCPSPKAQHHPTPTPPHLSWLWSAGWGWRKRVLNSLAREQQTHREQEQQTSAVHTSVNAASNNISEEKTKTFWLQLYCDS